MKWNWQQADWPNFHYSKTATEALESRFLLESGIILGSVKHLDDSAREQLTVELLSNEAVKTSEIEGELLDRDSVQSSILKHFGLQTSKKHVSDAEEGIAHMMVDGYRNWSKPLSHEQLFQWHRMLTNGRDDLRSVGCYRTHPEAMQVVSGYLHKPKVHFEAPPSERMLPEMDRFLAWFNNSGPEGNAPLPPLARAGIAHLWFVSIHPFEDGNGRIGRMISEKSLAQSLRQASLISLADTIERKRKGYYAALEAGNKANEVTDWLIWFSETVLEAEVSTQKRIEFILNKARYYDRLKDQLNARQAKAVERMFREGLNGFKGGLSADNYIRITGASRATATRDLFDLVDKGALFRRGERKHTRYYLNIPPFTETIRKGE
jgi:Fic family protein